MSTTFKQTLTEHMVKDQEYKILVKKSVYRIIGDSCRNVTPPSAEDEIVSIDYDLFEKESTAKSLVEPLSSKMARVFTITLHRVTHEKNTGMEQLSLVWTTGTVSTLCDIAKLLRDLSRRQVNASSL